MLCAAGVSTAHAGWTFTYDVTQSDCPGGTPTLSLPQIPAVIPTQASCESARALFLAIPPESFTWESGCPDACVSHNCVTRVVVGACTGTDTVFGSTTSATTVGGLQNNFGATNLAGPASGSPFLETHYSQTVQNWQAEAAKRVSSLPALNQEAVKPVAASYEKKFADESLPYLAGDTPMLLRPPGEQPKVDCGGLRTQLEGKKKGLEGLQKGIDAAVKSRDAARKDAGEGSDKAESDWQKNTKLGVVDSVHGLTKDFLADKAQIGKALSMASKVGGSGVGKGFRMEQVQKAIKHYDDVIDALYVVKRIDDQEKYDKGPTPQRQAASKSLWEKAIQLDQDYFVDSGLAEAVGGRLASGVGGPVGGALFTAAVIGIDYGAAKAEANIDQSVADSAQADIDRMEMAYASNKSAIDRIESDLENAEGRGICK